MARFSQLVAILTVLCVLSADLAAATCALDCRVASTPQLEPAEGHASCHSVASADGDGTHVGGSAATCHEDHGVPSAEVAPRPVRPSTGVVAAVLSAVHVIDSPVIVP